MIKVLDRGHVELKDSFGSDLKVVNFARASYMRESEVLRPRDEQLLRFLGSNEHKAPFYSCALDFSIAAPLMIARQWWKHVVASRHVEDPFCAWNEGSRRYVSDRMEFYIPEKWRTAPENGKQGSAREFSEENQKYFSTLLVDHVDESVRLFDQMIHSGVAPEQARLFLPAYGLFIHWRWTTSLYSVAHFVALRKAEGAQGEIQEYAKVVAELAYEKFPNAWHALLSAE